MLSALSTQHSALAPLVAASSPVKPIEPEVEVENAFVGDVADDLAETLDVGPAVPAVLLSTEMAGTAGPTADESTPEVVAAVEPVVLASTDTAGSTADDNASELPTASVEMIVEPMAVPVEPPRWFVSSADVLPLQPIESYQAHFFDEPVEEQTDVAHVEASENISTPPSITVGRPAATTVPVTPVAVPRPAVASVAACPAPFAQPLPVEEGDVVATDVSDDEPSAMEAEPIEPEPQPELRDWAEPVEEAEEEDRVAAGSSGGGWTIPLLCAGIAIIACCMFIPQTESNRRLMYERANLRADLESIQAQVTTNDEFLRKLASDPTLAERLAQRQMKMMRVGTKALPIGQVDAGMSPFDLVQVPAPERPGAYQPVGGRIASMCNQPRQRLYLIGGGLFLMAAGLVLGAGGRRSD